MNEERVKNAVISHLSGENYDIRKVKANDQKGVDIYAVHRENKARSVVVEAKGDTTNKTNAILVGWGQICSRISSVYPNRINGLASPKDWERNVAALTSPIAAQKLNIHFFFVDAKGKVEKLTSAQLRRKYPRRKVKH